MICIRKALVLYGQYADHNRPAQPMTSAIEEKGVPSALCNLREGRNISERLTQATNGEQDSPPLSAPYRLPQVQQRGDTKDDNKSDASPFGWDVAIRGLNTRYVCWAACSQRDVVHGYE